MSQETEHFDFVIVTGVSGAGKSQTLRHLEDLGYFCADNIVPALLVSFVELISTQFNKIAVGIDLRGGIFFDELSGCLHTLKEMSFHYQILFLDAHTDILVHRFSETRRRHPLQKEDMSLLESITQEKSRLKDIQEQAHFLLNTSHMKSNELKMYIAEQLIGSQETAQKGLTITVTSFGYRYGVPMDADLIFDVRFLPNPYYNTDLRSLTGLDRPVRDYVLSQEVTQNFIDKFFDFVNYLIPHYRQEGKSNLTVAIGCTGGRHRSVAITHELSRVLKEQQYYVLEKHRDVSKDKQRYQSQHKKLRPEDLNIVALGGGTGLSTILRGFKQVFNHLTAIVTVSDDGGSSGRLRKEMGVLPPGDIRNCLTALAGEEDLLAALFDHRFKNDQGDLSGHSFGNLFLTAMAEVTGDFQRAIQVSSRVLASRGQVLPVSLDDIVLYAEMQNGEVIEGESAITQYGGRIQHIKLKNKEAHALPETLEAIKNADVIILGPGSLYTSTIPHLLFPEVVSAILAHKGPRIFICNIMSQAGETTNYAVKDYIETLYLHAQHRDWLDYVLVNTQMPSSDVLNRYQKEDSFPVIYDPHNLEQDTVNLVEGEFLARSKTVRHDPQKLATTIVEILKKHYFPTL